jgi:hypothetical protein
MVAQVDGGSGHSGKRSQSVHFGLGAVAPNQPLPVKLRWRDRAGRTAERTLHLTPGWHTVLLGPAEETQVAPAQPSDRFRFERLWSQLAPR